MLAFIATLPYLLSAILVVVFILSYQFSHWAPALAGVSIVLFVLVWLGIVGWKNIARQQLIMVMSPVFFLGGAFGFFSLVDSNLLRWLTVLLTVLGLYIWLRALYFFHRFSAKYQPFSLQTQGEYINIITVFYSATLLYGLDVFLSAPTWALGVVLFFLMAIYMWQHLEVNTLPKQELGYALVFVFVLAQLFVVLSFLPFLVFVKGFMFLVAYYVFLQLYHHSTKGLWRKKQVFALLGGGALLWTIVLASTKWF